MWYILSTAFGWEMTLRIILPGGEAVAFAPKGFDKQTTETP